MKNKEEIKVNCEICNCELKENQANCIVKRDNYIICCDNCYNKQNSQKYDITDYLKDDKELQKAVIEELLKQISDLEKYIERMDKPEIQVIDAEILTLKEENAKLNAIIDGYQPKIQALKDDNERLKEEIKEVKKYQYEQEYLDKEIEEMQKALKTLAEGLNKRQILLQEIKEIAERCNLCEECSGLDDCERECGDSVEPCSYNRIVRRKWTFEKAISTPIMTNRRNRNAKYR